MAARFASHTTVLRSALAAHASLSASSLLYSAFCNSHLPTASNDMSEKSLQNYNENTSHDMSSISTALPWLDQLHNLIAGMYISGGVNNRCFIRNQQPHTNNVSMIKIGDNITYENPICSYLGEGELERAFKGRSFLHPINNVKTILECINVEASQDSIVGASQLSRNQHNMGIPQTISSSPPKIYITYQLQQQFGSFFTVNSLLVVTCQVRRCSSERVRKITNEDRLTMPLATSGVVRRSTIQSLAAVGGPISVALAKAKSKIVEAATNKSKHTDTGGYNLQPSSPPLVAEVIRIEERWNGVDLLKFAPFHLSRRLNGLVASSAAYFFFFNG